MKDCIYIREDVEEGYQYGNVLKMKVSRMPFDALHGPFLIEKIGKALKAGEQLWPTMARIGSKRRWLFKKRRKSSKFT